MTRQVLVSGMFRSGTTLLSRMLGASGRALVVADPCIYVLKAWRRRLALDLGLADFDPEGPTSDQFDPRYPELEAAIQSGDLSDPVGHDDLAWLRCQIQHWKRAQHPRLCARLDAVRGPTFADAWRALIELAADLYGTPGLDLIGTKISWCEEFLPALARAFPDLRVALLIRDIRAVVASQNSKTGPGAGKRPLLFYARHWRKSLHFTEALLAPDGALVSRGLRIRYEDLVRWPAAELRPLCKHLELPFDARMVDASAFRDESERPGWDGNSSFGPTRSAIHTASTDRWRQALSNDEIQALEAFCGPELERAGYSLTAPPIDPLDCLALDCEPSPEELSDWLAADGSANYLTDPAGRRRQYARESGRRPELRSRPSASASGGSRPPSVA